MHRAHIVHLAAPLTLGFAWRLLEAVEEINAKWN
jgi:hypothetical protein